MHTCTDTHTLALVLAKKARCRYISTIELKSDMAKSDSSRVLLKEIDYLPLPLSPFYSLNYGLLKFKKIFTCWLEGKMAYTIKVRYA